MKAKDIKKTIVKTLLIMIMLFFSLNSVLGGPANSSEINDTTPYFSWTYADNAQTNYTLKIDDNMDLGTPLQTSDDIQDTFYTLTAGEALADGLYYWGVDVYVNQVFNKTLGMSILRIDSTAPTPGTVTINGGDSYTNDTSLSLAWAGFTDAGSGLDDYYYSLTNNQGTRTGNNVNESVTSVSTTATEGNRTLYVWAEDDAENIGNSASDWIVIDTTSPTFGSWSESPSPLRYDHTGIFNISMRVTETNLLSMPECRFKWNGSSYSSWTDMTHSTGNYYYYTITQTWANYPGWTLTYQCNVTDAVSHKTNATRTEYVVANENAPVFVNLVDRTTTEDSNHSFTIDVTDADDDYITFTTSSTLFDIQNVDSNTARLWWVPKNDHVGDNSLTIRASDGTFTTNATITITVTGDNDPPSLITIGNIEGYLHEPLKHYMYATDVDNENNVSNDDDLAGLFSVVENKSWIKITSMYNFSNDRFVGVMNFTPLLSHKGKHNITIRVSDGDDDDTENILLTIGYCGDKDDAGEPKCDSEYEDCTTCPKDCGKCDVDIQEGIAIITPERNCLYTNFTMKTYELYERASCDTQGKIVEGYEVCGNLSEASITIYRLEDRKWEEIDQYITDSGGEVTFVPTQEGSYKMVAEYKSFTDAIKYIDFRECLDIKKEGSSNDKEETTKTNSTKEDTKADVDENKDNTKEPEIEKPNEVGLEGEEKEIASKATMLIYFAVLPLLVIGAFAGGYFYYQKEKNNKPWILKSRIWWIQKRKVIGVLVKRYWRKFLDLIGF